jgi:hypothetical protein
MRQTQVLEVYGAEPRKPAQTIGDTQVNGKSADLITVFEGRFVISGD